MELAEKFYFHIVSELIAKFNNHIPYSAALIGSGSEILGFDDLTSQDHHWGPRLQIFLSEADFKEHAAPLKTFFRENLPTEILGFSTHWTPPDEMDNNNQFPTKGIPGHINHRIEIYTLAKFLKDHLGISHSHPSLTEWCLLSEHQLLEFVSGKIFHDDHDLLKNSRDMFKFYPHEMWILKLAALWNEIGELLPLAGRTGSSGDNLGSQLISNQLVYLGMRLLFTIRKQFAPYPKWFGKQFTTLKEYEIFSPLIDSIFYNKSWKDREEALCTYFIHLGDLFNDLQLIKKINFCKKQFFTRSHYIIDSEDLIPELRKLIPPELVKDNILYGTVNEIVSLSQFRDQPQLLNHLKSLYE